MLPKEQTIGQGDGESVSYSSSFLRLKPGFFHEWSVLFLMDR